MAIIKNLTPHNLTVFDQDPNIVLSIPGAGFGGAARAAEIVEVDSFVTVEGVEVPTGTKTLTGELVGYEPDEGDTLYYVSLPFAMAVAAMGGDTSHLLVSLRDHRNEKGGVDGTYAIGRLVVA